MHIQGVLLAQTMSTPGQCMTLFHVWLVTVQVLDVHRRGLQTFVTHSGGVANPMDDPCTNVAGDRYGNFYGQECGSGQGQGHAPSTVVRAFYTSMLCNAIPAVCNMSSGSSITTNQDNKISLLSSSRSGYGQSAAIGTTTSGEGIAGMREMEYLVLFEMVAGFIVSGIMLLAWVTMAIRQGQGSRCMSTSARRLYARWQRIKKTIKGHAHDWRVQLEAKVDAFVDRAKFRIE